MENLEALGLMPDKPQDATTYKIQVLVRAKSNINELAAGVRLLRACPWSTTAEQQHASVALVHRMHPSIHLSTLLLRAAIHIFRRLLPAMSQEEKLVRQFACDLNKVLGQMPTEVNGNAIILQEVVRGDQA